VEGKEYVYSELLALGLNRKEIVGYMTFRGARNMTYQLRNGALSKSLMDRGYRTINHPALPPVFGRSVENGRLVGNAYDADTGVFVRVGDDWWRRNPNKSVFELNEPGEFGGKHSWYVVGTTTAINQTSISNAIPYRAGEYSRKYTDNYFVKYNSGEWLHKDGERWHKATRTATSKVEGEKYVAAFKEGLRLQRSGSLTPTKAASLMEPWGWEPQAFIDEVNSLPVDVDLSVLASRTESDYIKEGINIGMGTGGARGEHIKNVRGEDNALSPMDSLAAEISNASFVASTVEWRDNHIKLWYNTFRDILPANVQNMAPEDAFFSVVNSRQGRYVGNDKQRIAAQRVQDYLLQQLNVPSQEERYYQAFSRMLAESVEGEWAPSLLLGKTLRYTENFPKFIRTISFHSFFGFNPVQLLVQGMNAFNAIAISPVHGVKAGSMMPLYRVALMSDQESIWRNVAKGGSLAGMSEDEFVLSVATIRRSGLLDGINSTALYGAETGSLSLFNNVRRTTGTTSSFFFNRGEEASRLISWDIAKREWVKANPNGAWWEDDALRAIMERQDDLTQNMTTANTAFWQKGALSIPLQFFQYPVKLMMNLLASTFTGSHRAFSREDALRLMTMHLVFLGTAGNWWTGWSREVLGTAVEDLSPEQRLYVQQGVFAGVINSLSLATTDEKLELGLGSRLGTFNFYEDFINTLLDPEKPFLAMMSGASGGAIMRATDNFSRALSIYMAAPMDAETIEAAATMMLTGAFSVANNYEKALLASSWDAVLSKSGNQMYAVNNKERFMMKWGIPPAAQEDLSILFTSDKKRKDVIKRESALIGNLRERALLAIKEGDYAKAKSLYGVIRVRIDGIPDPSMRLQLEKAALSHDVTTKQRQMLMEIVGDLFSKDVLVNPNPAEVR
jgi:hypothetical protein